MANPQHVQWFLEGATAWNELRKNQDFIPDLSGEDFAAEFGRRRMIAPDGDPGLNRVNLTDASLGGCNFSGIQLAAAKFRGANLEDAQFEESLLLFADFTQSNLQNSNLAGAHLSGSKFMGAHLRGCKLDDARLAHADLVGANLGGSRFWRANLASLNSEESINRTPARLDKSISSVDDVSKLINRLKKHYSALTQNRIVFYFRGEAKAIWDLAPSVMRRSDANGRSLRDVESEMLVDLRSRRAEDFVDANSALEQMVVARHHRLPTRLLDVTRNPLVALFHASEKLRECPDSEKLKECPDADGRMHVFAVPSSLVKQFNSDTVSVVANFARLRRGEQNLVLGKTTDDAEHDIEPAYGMGFQLGDDYELAMNRLYQFIRLEKPSFQERIDPLDLLRVLVVEPQKSFRANSGTIRGFLDVGVSRAI